MLLTRTGDGSHRVGDGALLLIVIPETFVAVLLLARVPGHALAKTLAVYVACQLTEVGPIALARGLGGDSTEVFQRIDDAVWVGTLPTLPLLILLFPNGAGSGARRRVFHAVVAALAILAGVSLVPPSARPLGVQPVLGILAAGLLVSSVGSTVDLVVRAARLRSTRSELRPVAVAALLAVAVYALVPLVLQAIGAQGTATQGALILLVLGALPLGLGYAVLRHHLFGIERVLSRAVTYTILSVTLVAGYLVCVVLLTHLAGGSSDIGVAASTLAAAAAFQPLRLRVQRRVDRRFNRARYDAERVVESFAEDIRRTVDVSAVRERLVAAACATVQPRELSVWLVPGRPGYAPAEQAASIPRQRAG